MSPELKVGDEVRWTETVTRTSRGNCSISARQREAIIRAIDGDVATVSGRGVKRQQMPLDMLVTVEESQRRWREMLAEMGIIKKEEI